MALSKGLVELRGGSVAAHSSGAGNGTEFLVRLPLAAQAPRPSSPTPPPRVESKRRRAHVHSPPAMTAESEAPRPV
ncbi:MAG TPA: hypothetical protein VFP65_00900 [Anaeromyxobacteraceae bacterium]|nr:hypothetical protein [Anaeromyxobacteraceae bacterium]